MQRSFVVSRSLTRGFQQRFNSATHYEYILSEVKGNVGVITLNRPKQLNALCNDLLNEVIDAGRAFDKNDAIGAIIITGSEKAFAAGADIKEMSTMTYAQCYKENLFKNWTEIPKISKPVQYFIFNMNSKHCYDCLFHPSAWIFCGLLDHCGSVRLCSGWRLRAGHAVRHDHRFRERQVRPARDHSWRYSRYVCTLIHHGSSVVNVSW